MICSTMKRPVSLQKNTTTRHWTRKPMRCFSSLKADIRCEFEARHMHDFLTRPTAGELKEDVKKLTLIRPWSYTQSPDFKPSVFERARG